jgi:hypothetical protein
MHDSSCFGSDYRTPSGIFKFKLLALLLGSTLIMQLPTALQVVYAYHQEGASSQSIYPYHKGFASLWMKLISLFLSLAVRR